jgi:hypothetical protein
MRLFFGGGSSYKGAAERLNLHHNSVKYRVDRAVQRCSRRIGDNRIDVEIAVLVCHHLGSAVLLAAPLGVMLQSLAGVFTRHRTVRTPRSSLSLW